MGEGSFGGKDPQWIVKLGKLLLLLINFISSLLLFLLFDVNWF
jgi:hypothetical protein